jgi:hypothetical protein
MPATPWFPDAIGNHGSGSFGTAPRIARPDFRRRSQYLPPQVQFALLPFGQTSPAHSCICSDPRAWNG